MGSHRPPAAPHKMALMLDVGTLLAYTMLKEQLSH